MTQLSSSIGAAVSVPRRSPRTNVHLALAIMFVVLGFDNWSALATLPDARASVSSWVGGVGMAVAAVAELWMYGQARIEARNRG